MPDSKPPEMTDLEFCVMTFDTFTRLQLKDKANTDSIVEAARKELATLREKPTWDEAFKIVCHPCYKGHEVRRDGEGWCHPRGKYKLVCHASQLRTAALKGQERKDTDHDDA